MTGSLFQSFFQGGFECSTHRRRRDKKRLDMIAATAHDLTVDGDYVRLRRVGISTVREGLRWHLIERRAGVYDFTSARAQLHAARAEGMQVIWDLCHYGWPDWLDIFKPQFIESFARFAHAFARLLADEFPPRFTAQHLIAPINEISFFSWTSGQVGYFYPFAKKRGDELKIQLVRAAIAATESLWSVSPDIRIVHPDPVINILPETISRGDRRRAEELRTAQYQSWDMLSGRLKPELGGQEKYLDIIGVNYYPTNQWLNRSGKKIPRTDPRYKPFRDILSEVYERYARPLFIAETGCEGEARPTWLAYIGCETRAATNHGAQIEGICLYPIVNHPGWDDERHCHNGLWDYADKTTLAREIYLPLAVELQRQQRLFADASPQEANEEACETSVPMTESEEMSFPVPPSKQS